jgi:hypothetical protein
VRPWKEGNEEAFHKNKPVNYRDGLFFFFVDSATLVDQVEALQEKGVEYEVVEGGSEALLCD